MRNHHRLFLGIAVLGMALSITSYSRVFKNKNGREISAEITGIHGEDVELKMGVKKFRVPITSLSDEDQTFIADWERANREYKLRFSTKEVEDQEQRDRVGDGKKERKDNDSTWRYETAITNLSGTDLKDLQVHYNYFLRTTSTTKEHDKSGNQKDESVATKTGFHSIPSIENTRIAQFVTEWERVRDSEWQVEGNVVDEKGHKVGSYYDNYKKETIVDGIWVRVYLDNRMISEWKSEGKVIKDATWKKPTGAPPLAQVAKAQPQKAPGAGMRPIPNPRPKPMPNSKPETAPSSGDQPTAEEMENNPTLIPLLPQRPDESASAEVKTAFEAVEQAREAHQKGKATQVTFLNLQKLQDKAIAATNHYNSLVQN